MFLKFLDDLELQREEEAELAGKKFRPAIEAPYQWRDWAARADGITGDELLAFINNEDCVRPDGSKGAGLFAYLRKLTSANGDDRREVIATVFSGVDPIQFEEFTPCLEWWNKCKETDRAWKVPVTELLSTNCNLDRKNPRSKEDFEHLPLEQLADDVLKKEQRIAEIMVEIKAILEVEP